MAAAVGLGWRPERGSGHGGDGELRAGLAGAAFGVPFFFRALLRCGRRPSRRLLRGRGSDAGKAEAPPPTPPAQPPSELRRSRAPARGVPDLQGFASKLLEIPAVSLQWL